LVGDKYKSSFDYEIIIYPNTVPGENGAMTCIGAIKESNIAKLNPNNG